MPNAPHTHHLMLLVSSDALNRAPNGAPPPSLRSFSRGEITAVVKLAAAGAMLVAGVAGVAASAGIPLRRPETDIGAKP
jgi:hypothetical protein